jgi:hypothetical protein
LIYSFTREGPQVRLTQADLEILKDFLWYVPVNFPAQLLAQTQVLNRRAQPLPQGLHGDD